MSIQYKNDFRDVNGDPRFTRDFQRKADLGRKANLWNRVISDDYILTADEARSFVNNIYYGGFQEVFEQLEKQQGLEAGDIANAVQRAGLRALPVNVKVGLYEAIANDGFGSEGNAVYLNELNVQMGLTEAFYIAQTEEAHQFFNAANDDVIEAKWQTQYAGTFAQAMQAQIQSSKGLEDPAAQALAKHLIERYSEFTGRDCPEIIFVNEAENSCGATGCHADGTQYIKLNVNGAAFQGNFLEVVDTALHELKHIQQKELGAQYLAGEIAEDHPNYLAARVFAANLQSKAGYLSPDNEVGHHAYEAQPAEVDARTFGKTAAFLARQKYGAHNVINHNFVAAAKPTSDAAPSRRYEYAPKAA